MTSTAIQTQTPDIKTLREFGFIFGAGIALIFGVIRPLIVSEAVFKGISLETVGAIPVWPWMVCVVLAVIALTMPVVLAPVFKLWMKFGTVMGNINSRIILGIMFYAMVWPMGLGMRIMGRDPMMRNIDPLLDTYRVPSEKLPPKRMEKPY